ncbi:MAG TPA: methyl-accepting chemotaxis protein [Bacillota bacterium]
MFKGIFNVWHNASSKVKVAALGLIMLSILVTVALSGLMGMSDLKGIISALYQGRVADLVQVNTVVSELAKYRPLTLGTEVVMRGGNESSIQVALQAVEKKATRPEEIQGLKSTREAFEKFQKSGTDADHRAVLDQAHQLVVVSQAAANEDALQFDRIYRSREMAAGALFIFGALVMGAMGLAVARTVTKPVGLLKAAAEEVATGDLTAIDRRQIIVNKDESGRLGVAFKHMVQSFRGALAEVATASGQVRERSSVVSRLAAESADEAKEINDAIVEIAKGSAAQSKAAGEGATLIDTLRKSIEQLSQGAARQAEVVSKTSQLVAEVANAMHGVAESAQSVAQASAGTREAAKKGGAAVDRTVKGMERIKDRVYASAAAIRELGRHSQQIGEIIQVIEDIAGQTNLLALNAAIEAARAGEQGRGFAVVAEEVRKLAERSSRSTKEIAGLVETIWKVTDEAVKAMEAGTQEVDVGSELAEAAGRALGEILETAGTTDDQIQTISSAAQQVLASSEQLVEAVEAMAQVTEAGNAAATSMAGDSAKATQAMEYIASVSEESAAASQQVTSSTQSVAAAVGQMAGAAQSLAEEAERLVGLVGRFKV